MDKGFSHFNYISDAKGLILLAELLRAGRSLKGEYFCLTRDIDLGCHYSCIGYHGWRPIGSEEAPFAGIFDGCGHMITGLRINRPSEDYQGLFGNVSGVVKNTRLRDCFVVGRDFTGSVAGCVNGGAVRDVNAIGEVRGCNIVGGIVGSSVNSLLEADRFQGFISGKNYIGGISGSAWRSNVAAGINMGSLVKGRDCVGGITGSMFGGDLDGCRCTGSVNGRNCVGGMVGSIEDGKVLSCTVACNINGEDMAGAAGGFACGGNLIENCVFACSIYDGTRQNVHIADQVFTYNAKSIPPELQERDRAN